ncbi:MAG TPA: MBL fold metallo-hydrolase [Pseudomonadales bacterium]|nr:MBL fold metallo-hydrolase [Pseudomonadales bacterium]
MSTHQALQYPYEAPPPFGTTMELAPGVFWLQMPLPMSLKYINLYLLEDTDGWTVVDTGIRGEDTRELWRQIFDTQLGGKPVTRVICTHMHPDHTGQAGFVCEHFQAPLHMSFCEYYQARSMTSMMRDGGTWQMSEYFVRAGIEPGFLEEMRSTRSNFTPEPEDRPIPGSFIRLTDGDTVDIGKNQWQVITGSGHSPEHVCLYCKDLRVLISGDQILPVITSNVSVQPTEPFANPLVGWIDSHERFKTLLPNDLLVLPAHNLPFYGVQERLQQLIDHHEDRMLILEENCEEPQIAIDLLPYLFSRVLDGHSRFMALGECIAHLHCLMTRQRIERILDGDVFKYRSIDPTLKERARPGQHEAPDETPEMV